MKPTLHPILLILHFICISFMRRLSIVKIKFIELVNMSKCTLLFTLISHINKLGFIIFNRSKASIKSFATLHENHI